MKNYSWDTISRYLDLEHDFAARSLAISLAKKLSTKFNVLLLVVNCDRGIMDANRLSDHCISSVIQKTASSDTIIELQNLNKFIREQISDILNKHLHPGGYILDVHSMWPFTMNIPNSKKNNLDDFSKSFMLANHLGKRRNLNFIVHQDNGEAIADKEIASFIERELTSNKYPVQYDEPFSMDSIRSNYQYFKSYRGIAFDVPRDFLGKRQSKNPLDFSFMIEDKRMIDNLSHTIASGIIKLKSQQELGLAKLSDETISA